MNWRRDLSLLNNTDRRSRIHALDSLKHKLELDPLADEEAQNCFLRDVAGALVDRIVSDPAERCRDLSLSILSSSLSSFGAKGSLILARCLIPAAAERFGSLPFKEPVEELRLRLIEACSAVLLQSELGDDSQELTQHFACCLKQALSDTYPDSKRSAAIAISKLCKIAPQSIQLHFVNLTKSLALNLGHQHAKTRIITIDAIVDVSRISVTASAFVRAFRKVVLPALFKLCTDRSAAVRAHLAQSVGAWLLKEFHFKTCQEAAESLEFIVSFKRKLGGKRVTDCD